jgi:hypothetical protein
MENWKNLSKNSPYEISDLGRCRKNGKLKKLTQFNNGYLHTKIHGRWKLVHVLVLTVFKPNPAPCFFDRVDHLNRQKTDNRLANLRWSNSVLNGWNMGNVKGYSKKGNRFAARIHMLGSEIHLGCFATPTQARARYLEARRDAMDIHDPFTIY